MLAVPLLLLQTGSVAASQGTGQAAKGHQADGTSGTRGQPAWALAFHTVTKGHKAAPSGPGSPVDYAVPSGIVDYSPTTTTTAAPPSPSLTATTSTTAPPPTTTTTTAPPPTTTTAPPAPVQAPVAPAPTAAHSASGAATWYGAPDGVCASPSLPYGVTVTVTNQANGASVSCTIGDREEDTSRLIDMNPTSFSQIASLDLGVVQVTVTW